MMSTGRVSNREPYGIRDRIMSIILGEGEAEQYRLDERVGCAQSAVVLNLKKLEAEGLIVCRQRPNSRSFVRNTWMPTSRGLLNPCPHCGAPRPVHGGEGG